MAYRIMLDDDGADDRFVTRGLSDGAGRNGGLTLRDGYRGDPGPDTVAVAGADGHGDLAFTVGTDTAFQHAAFPIIAPSDFGQTDEVAFIAGVYADGTLPLYAFSAWNDDNPATYTGGFTPTAKWGASSAPSAGGTIKFYFTPGSNWSATEQQFLSAGLALWSDVANISFVQTSVSSQAQIVFTRGSDGGAATSPHASGPPEAGQTGGNVLLTLTKATISIDTSVAGFGPIDGTFTTQGGYPIMTFLHEEGHALGLGHAGPYNGTVNPSQQQFSAYDTRLWSIMSYIEPRTTSAQFFGSYPVTGTNWGFGPSGFRSDPTGLMPLDILAIQALYGTPTSTPLSGGQIFGFHSNVTGPSAMFFDFTQNTVPILTLWDMGTGNTLDLSGYSTGSTVNLTAGTFSSFAGMVNNLGIAFGTAIDGFVGTGGADNVTANAHGDTLTGGAGNDQLTGGAGSDTAVYSGAISDYHATDLGGGVFQLQDLRGGSPDGTDTLSNIEYVTFSGGTVAVSSLFGNTAPTLSGAGNSVGYTEQAAAVAIDPGLVVADDGATLAGATVTISAGFVAGDGLSFTDQNGITGSYNAGTHVLTLSGTASVANYQAALRSVGFSSTSDDPTNGGHTSRTIGFQVSDGAFTSGTAASTVNITAVDDPPVLHNDSVSTAETTTLIIGVFANNGNGADSDPDGPALQVVSVNGGPIATQQTLASGALLIVGGNGALTFTPNHAYDALPAAGSGAVNTAATETITIGLLGGYSETVTITVNGVDSDDTLLGNGANNTFDGGTGIDTLVFTGAHGSYAVSYDELASRFTFADQRIGSPDGSDTAKNIEFFRFSDGLFTFDTQGRPTTQTVVHGDGSVTNTLFDAADTATWASQATLHAANGSILNQTITLDNGNYWQNSYDTTNAANWLWITNTYDALGRLMTAVNTLDDGTHSVIVNDVAGQYAWSSFTVFFNAAWAQIGFAGTNDNGTHTLTFNDVAAVFDTTLWFAAPYDADFASAPADTVLTGGAGIDVLYGHGGNDTLNGAGGNDYLNGGLGNDTLTGGAGDDRFFFKFADGLDTVTDFTPGNASGDVIELHDYGVSTFAALQAFMTQSGADTVIAFDDQNHIVLHNVTMSALNSGDFVFT